MTTITIHRALLEQALAALESCTTGGYVDIDGDFQKTYRYSKSLVDDALKAIRAELAKPVEQSTPAWHDAPTCDGLWMCNEGDDNPYRWTTHRVTFPLNQLLVGEDERWYGPIPQEGKKS